MDIIKELLDCGIIYNSVNGYRTVKYDLKLYTYFQYVIFYENFYIDSEPLRVDIEKTINYIDILTNLLYYTDIKSEYLRQTIFTKEEFVIIIDFVGSKISSSLNSYKYNSKKFNDLNEFIEFLREYHPVLFKPTDIKIALK